MCQLTVAAGPECVAPPIDLEFLTLFVKSVKFATDIAHVSHVCDTEGSDDSPDLRLRGRPATEAQMMRCGFACGQRSLRDVLPSLDGQFRPASHAGRPGSAGVVVIDIPVGPSLEDLFERDPPLEPGQSRAEAEVQSLAEAQVTARPVDVVAVGFGEFRLVAIG